MSAILALFGAFRERVRASMRAFDRRLKRVEEHQLTQQRQLEELRQGQAVTHRNQEEALKLLRRLTDEFPEFKTKTEERLHDLERLPVRN